MAVHGTLIMIQLAWKFNSKQLLCKTLNSRMNIIETRAVLNIIQKDGKWNGNSRNSVDDSGYFDVRHLILRWAVSNIVEKGQTGGPKNNYKVLNFCPI